MMHKLVRVFRGKRETIMVDDLTKVSNHRAKMRQSQRKGIKGQRVEYEILPADDEEKFKKPPHKRHLHNRQKHPRVPR